MVGNAGLHSIRSNSVATVSDIWQTLGEETADQGHRIVDLTDYVVEQVDPGGNVIIDLREAQDTEFDLTDAGQQAAFPEPLDLEPLDLAAAAIDGGLLAASRGAVLAKRIVDVALSVVAILALAPVLLLTAFAVGLTSRGPVLYVQRRIGRGGSPFPMLKFRSMYADAEARKASLAALNEASGPVFKVRRDPRITPIGRIIRKLSIDELPQLFNVLRGDMSLVGPRPPLPDEYEQYDARALRRLLVTPGLTCIWQVSGRSNIDFDEWVELDVQYICNWSLRLDLSLLLRTVPAVLTGRGAY